MTRGRCELFKETWEIKGSYNKGLGIAENACSMGGQVKEIQKSLPPLPGKSGLSGSANFGTTAASLWVLETTLFT